MFRGVEQILNTAQQEGVFERKGRVRRLERERKERVIQEERKRCRKFLQYVRDTAMPDERKDEWYLPVEELSPLGTLMDAAKSDGGQLEHLLGEFWETRFCDVVSLHTKNCYTKLLQRYKTHGEAHASRDIGLFEMTGRNRDDIPLPDALLYQRGKGLIAHIDIKHLQPRQYYPDVGVGFYSKRQKLFGDTPMYYAVHSYLPFDFTWWKEREFEGWRDYWVKEHLEEYENADMWSTEKPYEGWIIARLTPDVVDNSYINLTHFLPAEEMLKDLAQGQKDLERFNNEAC